MADVFQNEKVEHSLSCHSTKCDVAPEDHCSVYYFITKTDAYYAESVNEAARLWIRGGAKTLLDVARLG